MIRAQELRIGNLYIGYDDNYDIVDCDLFKMVEDGIDLDEIIKSPVELSEEILLKVGFERSSSITPLWVGADPMLIWRTEYESDELENYFEFRFGITESYKAQRRVRLDALHQLQNLYFALTGEELDVSKLI